MFFSFFIASDPARRDGDRCPNPHLLRLRPRQEHSPPSLPPSSQARAPAAVVADVVPGQSGRCDEPCSWHRGGPMKVS
ncbi:hypothetical protein EJB05_27062, partial [Eragrostis curvula]